MSESFEGASVAATRQKAGRFLKLTPGGTGLGGVNSPAATVVARVMVVFGRVTDAKLSHDAAADTGTASIGVASRIAMSLADVRNFTTAPAAFRHRPTCRASRPSDP